MEIKKIETNLKRNLILHSSSVKFSQNAKNLENHIIRINPAFSFQKFLGFGGALTESSCYVLSTIDQNLSQQILKEYFSPDNLNYQFCRISIGSCDFSLSPYSYSYQDDLSDFQINRDQKYVIPILKEALKWNPHIQFVSSPWSPPAFMKTNRRLTDGGKLLPSCKKLWTQYLIQYVLSYQHFAIPIHYMTIQNEPNAKQIWESCLYSASEEADLLKNYLYPNFRKNGLMTKFLIWDHNKDSVLERSLETLVDSNALDYADRHRFSLVYWWAF